MDLVDIILYVVSFLCLFTVLLWYIGRRSRLMKAHVSKESSSYDFHNRFNRTKKIELDGVPFEIRKINIIDYLEGAKVLQESFSVYKTGAEKKALENIDSKNIVKLKGYLADVICAGVVKPKFVRTEKELDAESILIDDLFLDWQMAQDLTQEIFSYTHGKKK